MGQFNDTNYKSLLSTKHKREMENAITEFKSNTKDVHDRESIDHKITQLTNAMEDFKNNKIKTFDRK